MLIDELSKNMQSRKQTDLILLDFSKAFANLLQILHGLWYKGGTLKWIKDSLDNRKHSVITNGTNSSTVSSGVPQGSVL